MESGGESLKPSGHQRGVASMRFLLLLVAWCLLLVLCWPLALLVLIAFPLVWLICLPFRLFFMVVEAVFSLIRAVLLLPARILK